MKDIIKKAIIGVLCLAVVFGVAYKFVFSDPEPSGDPYGSTNGVIDGTGQAVTDANRPDCFISHFSQLLELFPPLKENPNEAM